MRSAPHIIAALACITAMAVILPAAINTINANSLRASASFVVPVTRK